MVRTEDSFDNLLDRCLDALRDGESVESILARAPGHAGRLEPLLRSAATLQEKSTYEPSDRAIAAARTRLNEARIARAASRNRPSRLSWLGRLSARPVATAGIATIAVLALTAVLVLRPFMEDQPPVTPAPSDSTPTTEEGTTSTDETPNPTESGDKSSGGSDIPASTLPLTPHADGNFVFYVSDQPNDIGDFESLIVTVSSIQIKPVDDGPWLEIEPETTEADLVELQGERAQQLWRGDLPKGEYQTVFVHVDSIEGMLAGSGALADVKLPSDKLHLETRFSVTGTDAVEFVFDITVHRTGSAGEETRYILSPQASESGIGQEIDPIQAQHNAQGNNEDKPGKSGDDPQGGADTAPDVEPPRPGPGPGQPNPRFGEYLS